MNSFRSNVGKTRKRCNSEIINGVPRDITPLILPCKKDRARIRRRALEVKYKEKVFYEMT
jgi:hypothetical protein